MTTSTIISTILFLSKFELINTIGFSLISGLIPLATSLTCFTCGPGGNCNDPFSSTSSSQASGVTLNSTCGGCTVSDQLFHHFENISCIHFFCFYHRKQVQARKSHVVAPVLVPVSLLVPLPLDRVQPAVQIEIIAMERQIFISLQLFSSLV